jgi:hypothetical protein
MIEGILYRCPDRSQQLQLFQIRQPFGKVVAHCYNVVTFDDGTCEVVTINIDTMNSAVVCICRPPDANTQSFNKLLASVQKYLNDCNPFYQKYVTGNFNLPNINWTSLHVSHTLSRENTLCATSLINLICPQTYSWHPHSRSHLSQQPTATP